ncbi:MAG: hypothetical protein A2014_10955 [Spirochaetes bacterium GWF1_49_6]|jgi:hypothetical protein|nr:MAG: hypothetical protein A2014_10955 [Spirochaetes bacterium GWF1_49_6]
MKMKSFGIVAFIVLALTYSLNAQTTNATAPASTDGAAAFGAGLQFGSMMINGTNYNSIRLQPDFSIGKFGVGLDLNFEFDANGNFRTQEWSTWQSILSKILFLRWSKKEALSPADPVYVKIGSINDFTLGHGLAVYRYSNMLNYPDIKKMGLAFDMDFGYVGFESFVGNIFDWDLMGMRIFGRPLYNSGIPMFDTLQIGATWSVDLDPLDPVPPASTPYDFTDSPLSSPMSVYGFDASLVVFANPIIDMLTYVDFVGISGKGSGEFLGVIGKVISIIPYRFELRVLQPKFLPNFFDTFYDGERATKYALLDSITNGYGGWLFSSGISLFEDKLIWTLQIEDSFDDTTKPILTMQLLVKKELLQKFAFKFAWIRQNIAKFEDIFSYVSTDSILMTDIEYYVTDTLAIVLSYKRTFKLDAAGVPQEFVSTAISTKMAF